MSGQRGGSRLRQASMKNFNPRLIFSQIVALQCFHYLSLGLLVQINHVLYGQSVTVDRMFTDEYLKVWHGGWQDAFAVFFSYAVVGYVLCRCESSVEGLHETFICDPAIEKADCL